MSRQTINAIENDKYDPTLQLAFDIAFVLGTSVDQLFVSRPIKKLTGLKMRSFFEWLAVLFSFQLMCGYCVKKQLHSIYFFFYEKIDVKIVTVPNEKGNI